MSSVTPYFGEALRPAHDATPRDTVSSNSFSEMLSERTVAFSSPARAYGFGELGMFGLHGGLRMPAVADARAEHASPRAMPSPEAEPTQSALPPVRPPAVEPTTILRPNGTPPLIAVRPAPDAAIVRASMTVRSAERAPTTDDEISAPAQRSAPAKSAPKPPATKATFALAAGGNDRALVVVARANLSAAETADIRRRLNEAASEFGVCIGDLRLNGQTLPQYAIQGGPNGRSAR